MKNSLKKFAMWVAVIVTLISSIFLPGLAFADRTVTVPSVYGTMKDAAEKYIIASKMKQCLTVLYDKIGDGGGGSYMWMDKDSFGQIFNPIDTTNINTGAWMEYQVQGKVDDGEIWCKNNDANIINVFARAFGFKLEEIYCDKTHPEYGGLLTYYSTVSTDDGDSRVQRTPFSGCASHLNIPKAQYHISANGIETNTDGAYTYLGARYIQSIYDEYVQYSDNPYLTKWDELQNYTDEVRNYFAYLNDFNTACSTQGVTENNRVGTNYFKPIKSFDTDTYAMVDIYYSKSNIVEDDWDKSFGPSGKYECEDVVTRLNELAPAVHLVLTNDKSVACNEAGAEIAAEVKKEANEIIDNPESTDAAKRSAQNAIKQIDDMNRVYWEFTTNASDPNYGVVCKSIPDATDGSIDIDEEDSGATIDPSGNQDQQDACYKGAGVLGWIVCPVTQGLTDLGAKAYKWVEENFLQVKASIFSEDSNGVRTAWSTIRNIANVGFIIMLLFVIVSQVTGFGIDNYGIKRILPKLIVGAIVMNLSYIICELMIDVSNIAGSGLKDILTGMGPGLPTNASSYAASGGQYATVFGVTTIAVAIGMILSSGGLGAILMLFVALLSVVIAILVLFVVLIVRQAGIVVCVVIAPIAVMCYLLPNTEKYFKKWFDLMKGLLLVYPLCGLIIGAGDFVGRIFGNLAANSNDNLQMGFALSAMVVTAIPYLFIPTLLKSSLAAMGNLGAKISGLGARLRGGASGKVRNSNAMKNSKERAAEYRTRVKAGVDRNGNDKQLGKFRRALHGGKRGMARARAQYLRNQDTRNREDSLMNVGFQAAVIGQQKRAEKDEMADYMTLINNETRNGEDAEALYKMYDDYMAKGNKAGAVAVARIAGRRKDTAADFMSKKITGYDNKTGEISDVAAGYNPALLSSVMKEVATGENSGNYRTSTPMGFEFAAQYNREYDPNSAEAPEAKYSEWRNKSGNVDRALDNYVTNSQELMGIKNSSLGEMNRLIVSGGVDPDKAARIQRLASEAIDNRGKTGIWDSTKAENIYKLAGREAEYRAMVNNAAGSVRGENAAAGAEASTMDVRAESTAQTQSAQAQQTVQRATQAQQVAGGAPAPVIQEAVSRTQAPQIQTPQVQTPQVQTPQIQQAEQGSAIDLRAMGDETLLDIATNPNARMDDATRTAAEREYMRRVNAASQHTPPMERPQTPKVNPPENNA